MARGWAELVQQHGHANVASFTKTVTTAGTAEKLIAAETQCRLVYLSADLNNTNPIVVGDSNVVAAGGSQRGIVIVPGNAPVPVYIDDLSKLYADSQTDGDKICGTYFW